MKFIIIFILFLSACGSSNNNQTQATKREALVLIDVWDREYLTEYVTYIVNPLIRAAKARGVLVIHARYLYDVHPLSLAADIEIKDYETLQGTLEDHGIERVYYAGYDALLCVIDKPAGIVTTMNNNPNLEIVVLQDALFSGSEDMKALAINLLSSLVSVQHSNVIGASLPTIAMLDAVPKAIVTPTSFDAVVVLGDCGEIPSGIPVINPTNVEDLEGFNKILYVGNTHDVLFGPLGSIAVYQVKRYQHKDMPKTYAFKESLCGDNINELQEFYTARNFQILE